LGRELTGMFRESAPRKLPLADQLLGRQLSTQLKTFSIVDLSVSFCRKPLFRSRKPAGRLCALKADFGCRSFRD